MKRQIGIYVRISDEDVDKRTNKNKADSNSIVAQRYLIEQALDKMPDLRDLPRQTFCDDGFSGTTFDRPDFLRLMDAVKRGEIHVIIVKDLSRFGRDYIEVGDYLEHIFPFLGVRFISVNDGYDSDAYIGKTGGVDVILKNLLYDYYSRDLSKKVKSAMGLKQQKAQYVNCVPYGYRRDPERKHHMVLDEQTAPIVRRIFLEIIAGKTPPQIALALNEEGILSPKQYRSAVLPAGTRPAWTHRTIHTLLGNIKYTGTMVNHLQESRRIRDTNLRRVPADEWYVREGAHAPIVTQSEYAQAQAAIRRRKPSVRKKHDTSDRVYYCGHCGYRLEKANGTVFACGSRRFHTDSPCAQVYWKKAELEEVVLKEFRVQMAHIGRKARKADRAKHQESRLAQQLASQQAEIAACDREKFSQYEAYRSGALTAEEFMAHKAALAARQAALEEQLHRTQARYEQSRRTQLDCKEEAGQVCALAELPPDELRRRMYDAIARVTVFDRDGIEIQWKSCTNIQAPHSKEQGIMQMQSP